MRSRKLAAALTGAALFAAVPAVAQEQFVPLLVYRSGAYAPNGIPFANGVADYMALINERDGGVNGVKLAYEECDTAYQTDRGVECYERLKGKGAPTASSFAPLSTGITFALTEKAPGDKIPLLTMGYGRSESADGRVFQWNFPLLGTYWSAADIIIQHLGAVNGGLDKLKDKKIALVYHDSPYGREPIPLLERRAQMHGYQLSKLPVTAPGIEQKAVWLQVRQQRPDYVLLWGWGIMNSTAIKEAVAVGYPREKMFGVWWSGAEPDVLPAGVGAKGYNALAMNPAGKGFKVHQDIAQHVYAKNKGAGPESMVGEVLYNRGVIDGMLRVEAIRTAMARFGNKPMAGEQVRWGFENLNLDAARLRALGFEGLMTPIKVSCEDHEGSRKARIHQWDGTKWVFKSDWIEADNKLLRPMVDAAAAKYAEEKKITPSKCGASS
ncbi:MAG: ABC transporter substrate-binding protein [Alphaproteobacteria bacterium]|nr:ABC transporter substrate-binding protein [Alphaproteobacteria bacterium]